jgi:hypothetical protein
MLKAAKHRVVPGLVQHPSGSKQLKSQSLTEVGKIRRNNLTLTDFGLYLMDSATKI